MNQSEFDWVHILHYIQGCKKYSICTFMQQNYDDSQVATKNEKIFCIVVLFDDWNGVLP